MQVQAYINSGIIEDYCLGLLGPKEREEVAQFALQHEEIRIAIEECEYALKRFVEDSSDNTQEASLKKEKLLKLLKIKK